MSAARFTSKTRADHIHKAWDSQPLLKPERKDPFWPLLIVMALLSILCAAWLLR